LGRIRTLEDSPELLPHECGIDGIVKEERKTVLDRERGGALREYRTSQGAVNLMANWAFV
jgi:hypothetical protein